MPSSVTGEQRLYTKCLERLRLYRAVYFVPSNFPVLKLTYTLFSALGLYGILLLHPMNPHPLFELKV